MDKLSVEQKGQLTKMPTLRLQTKLLGIGFEEETVEAMDRPALLDAWANAILAGKDKPKPVVAPTPAAPLAYDAQLEKQKLDFDKMRFEEEIKLKRAEQKRADEELQFRREESERAERLKQDELKQQREESERAERQKQDELKRADEELQFRREESEKAEKLKRDEMDLLEKMKRDELDRLDRIKRDDEKRERERLDSPIHKAKLFGEALRGSFAKMPTDYMEIMSYFRGVERLYDDLGVPAGLRVHLLKPHLTEQARNLLARMDPGKATDYGEVKRMLLHEFKLSAPTLLERFNISERVASETFTIFANRLKSTLLYYVEARKATTYELLIELLVCDKIKTRLTGGALRHVMSVENQTENGWLRLDKLVETLDIFYSTHSVKDEPLVPIGSKSNTAAATGPKQQQPPQQHQNSQKDKVQSSSKPSTETSTHGKQGCWKCGSTEHKVSYHFKKPYKPAARANISACMVSGAIAAMGVKPLLRRQSLLSELSRPTAKARVIHP